MPNQQTPKIGLGTKFHYTYADCNALWRVEASRGKDVWDCVVDEESYDYVGTQKVFGSEEILSSLTRSAFFSSLENDHDAWWNSRKAGEIVHYSYGWGQFVRCVIVEDNGEKKARPTALVGEWRQHDLPHVTPWGKVEEGYQVKKIREGELFKPNYTNMYEAKVGSASKRDVDPRNLPEIDLTIPALTDAQLEAKRVNELREIIIQMLSGKFSYDDRFAGEVTSALKMARGFLNEVDL